MADHVEETTSNTGRLAINNTVYDFAKEAATVYLPGLAAFYATVAAIWHLPFPTEVAATIAAVVTLLGVMLKVSTASYNNGKTDNPDNQKVQTSDETLPGVEYAEPITDTASQE